jgi:hypothetical protein
VGKEKFIKQNKNNDEEEEQKEEIGLLADR